MPNTRQLLVLPFIVAGMLLPTRSFAQGPGMGYAFGGPLEFSNLGERSIAWSVGGGGEHVVDSTGVGGDVEVVHFPAVNFRSKTYGYSMPPANAALVSGNGYHHFSKAASNGVRPFLTAGGGLLLAGEASAPTFNAGGGLDWWADRRTGIRLEVRDQIVPSTYGLFQLSLALRVGLIFR